MNQRISKIVLLGSTGNPLEVSLGTLSGKATFEIAQRLFFCHKFLSFFADLSLDPELDLAQLCKCTIS